MGVGECAGEVVPFVQMGLAASEREVFEAQMLLDEGNAERRRPARLQRHAAGGRALAREKNPNLGDDPDEIVGEFRTHCTTPSCSGTPTRAASSRSTSSAPTRTGQPRPAPKAAHQLIEEAQLFVDAAHQCYTRIGSVMP